MSCSHDSGKDPNAGDCSVRLRMKALFKALEALKNQKIQQLRVACTTRNTLTLREARSLGFRPEIPEDDTVDADTRLGDILNMPPRWSLDRALYNDLALELERVADDAALHFCLGEYGAAGAGYRRLRDFDVEAAVKTRRGNLN